MERYTFEAASAGDVDAVMGLISQRIGWFESKGINQWKREEYFEEYPREYFERCARRSQLFVMRADGEVCGCVVLSDFDPVWEDDGAAIYIHNLATDPRYPGVGRRIMALSEQHACRTGKTVARLDCRGDNAKLNAFYAELGYELVGMFTNGGYYGAKRQKNIAARHL